MDFLVKIIYYIQNILYFLLSLALEFIYIKMSTTTIGFKPTVPTKVVPLQKSHNMYSDIANKWAPSAFEKSYSVSEIFCFFSVVFLIGWLTSQIIMFSFLPPVETRQEIEILEPTIKTYIEPTTEYIDYAAQKNGGQINYLSSSPEFHGWAAVTTENRLDSLISDNNGLKSCWPIQGKEGHAAIQLGKEIYPTGFTIVLPKKFVNTIPKQIYVYNFDFGEKKFIGEVEILVNSEGRGMKDFVYFDCISNCNDPCKNVLVEVVDNYGGENTCMYQFKVHGLPTRQ